MKPAICKAGSYEGHRTLQDARRAAEEMARTCRYVCVIRQADEAYGIKWWAVASRLISYCVEPRNWGGEVFREDANAAAIWD